MSEGFLGRWSKRKLAVKQTDSNGEELSLDASAETLGRDLADAQVQGDIPAEGSPEHSNALQRTRVDAAEAEDLSAPMPTEQDLDSIKSTGNVSAFMNERVSQELKNKAFKELFKLAAFKHVDMMDVYMEDYSKFTPLSPDLRDKMAFAKQLLRGPDDIEDELNDSDISPDMPLDEGASPDSARNTAREQTDDDVADSGSTDSTPLSAAEAYQEKRVDTNNTKENP